MMNDVCAVIVTYNRAELLCRCVGQLLKQDYPLDVLIYDNHSTTNTREALEAAGLLRNNVCYHYAETNTGGSGGFYYGMEMAVKKGYQYLWLMDDDGYPMKNDTLSILMNAVKAMPENHFALNSLVVQDDEASKTSFAVRREFDVEKLRAAAENGIIEGEIMPFNGTLIPVRLVEKIGYPVKEFFVYGDENEYFLRLKQAGAKMAIVVDSLYRHPTNVQKVKKILGRNVYYMDMPLWKTYCAARNRTYIAKKYYGIKGVANLCVKDMFYLLAVPGKRFQRMVTTIQGRIDGYREDFSKKLDFRK